ncbi:MAG: hypothetical protein AAB948_02730, partial [Patescibacteria group bacterium]
MGIDEYEKVLLKKDQNQLEDIDEINRKIIQAQKQEDKVQTARQTAQEDLVSEVIDSTFSFEPEEVSATNMQNRAELEDI